MALSQRAKISLDINKSVADATKFNKNAEVITRQMTEEERKELEWQTTKHESCHKLKVIV